MKTQIILFFALVVFVTGGLSLDAQDFGAGRTAAQAEAIPQVNIHPDRGVAESIRISNIPHAPDVQRIRGEGWKPANELLYDWAVKHGLPIGLGEDDPRGRIFFLAHSEFNTDDPRTDPNFLVKRERAARIAELRARAQIVRYIGGEMEAIEERRINWHQSPREITSEITNFENIVARLQHDSIELLEHADRARADVLRGVTLGDRLTFVVDTILSQFGRDFDATKIETDKREKYERLMAELTETQAKLNTYERHLQSIRRDPTQTYRNEVSGSGRETLLGVQVLEMEETWDPDNKEYEVAVLVVWSYQLQRLAIATLAGDVTVISDGPGEQSLTQWINSKGLILGAKIGSWRYVDNRGIVWYLGVSARPRSNNALENSINRERAEEFARAMALFSLFADIEVQVGALDNLDDFQSDQDTLTEIESRLDSSIVQKFPGRRVAGLGPVGPATREVIHPITRLPINVAVYGVSSQSVASAMEAHKKSIENITEVNRNWEYQRGQIQGLNRKVEASRNNPVARAAGEISVQTPTTGVPLPTRQPGQTTPPSTPSSLRGGALGTPSFVD